MVSRAVKQLFYTVLGACICYSALLFIKSYCSQSEKKPCRVIIVGASSGIGAALAKVYGKRGCYVGLTGRRKNLLDILKQEIGDNCWTKIMDVAKPEEAQRNLRDLIKQMGGMDLLIISAGTGTLSLDWAPQKETINVNVMGFVALTSTATEYFMKQASGHLVGISSIFALRGSAGAPVYSASKAFQSNYLAGLRARFKRDKVNIYITDIQPGLVDTAMGQVSDFWRATPEEAAEEIYAAIDSKHEHAYITARWRVIAWLFKWLPDTMFYKFF
jgi:short-subunit dehydrogenase